jgi:hypothetical protein
MFPRFREFPKSLMYLKFLRYRCSRTIRQSQMIQKSR